LRSALENAATAAHPGHVRVNDHIWEIDNDAPQGAALIRWFKKTHPRKAALIRQKFIERMLGA
jgi:hypothetical protein